MIKDCQKNILKYITYKRMFFFAEELKGWF